MISLINHRCFTKSFTIFVSRSFSNMIYKNKNPHNLELMGLADKTKGWELQAPRKDFWLKVLFQKTSSHTTGHVMYRDSKVVVHASTREPSIRKYLYSCTDISAAENIGKVLAYRCHQCGLLSMLFDVVETPLTNESVKAFYDSMLDGGINLVETPEYEPAEAVGIDYTALTFEEKRSYYPSLIENLRTIPDWDNIPYPYSLRPKGGKIKVKNCHQILSKVRQGMVWDPIYCRMIHPKDKAYWQREFEESQCRELESKGEKDIGVEPCQQVVPVKWQLD